MFSRWTLLDATFVREIDFVRFRKLVDISCNGSERFSGRKSTSHKNGTSLDDSIVSRSLKQSRFLSTSTLNLNGETDAGVVAVRGTRAKAPFWQVPICMLQVAALVSAASFQIASRTHACFLDGFLILCSASVLPAPATQRATSEIFLGLRTG